MKEHLGLPVCHLRSTWRPGHARRYPLDYLPYAFPDQLVAHPSAQY